jgi:hypothetical protein
VAQRDQILEPVLFLRLEDAHRIPIRARLECRMTSS